MPQAKVLSKKELDRVMAVIAAGRNPARNRVMMLLSFWAGMRVGEIAALTIGDVVGSRGSIKGEIYLKPVQTKGDRGRTVLLGEKLRKELAQYIATLKNPDPTRPLIYSQKHREGFSANTLCLEFKTIYMRAGIDGATSHSGRRTFITNLANKGIGVRVLMALAGHRNISTTQLYIDVNDDMKRIAVNLL